MIRAVIAGLLVVHGLTHAWFVVLAQRLVPYEPAMGWTGESWLLTGPLGESITRWIASVSFVVATLLFIVAGIGLLAGGDWVRAVAFSAAAVSMFALIVFWDGGTDLLVQKGLIGVVIDIAVLWIFIRAYPFIL